jgi:hypothetical protein
MAGVITGAVIATAGNLFGASMQADATQNAANTQANAALTQQGNLLAAGQTASKQFEPYAQYGATPLASLTANNPYFNQQFTAADLKSNLAPNYEFMKQQGLGATSENINVGGGGSNANLARTKFAEDYASNAYQQAFNNFQAQRGNIAAIDLANTGVGLAGSTGSANAQLGTATNIANLGIGSANAQAASQIAQGNIYGGAANSLGGIGYATASQLGSQNTAQNYAMQNQLSAGGYGSNALNNFINNPSTDPNSSSFIGPKLS